MSLYLIAKFGHFLAIACGVGGAIASDFLFMRSIRDRKISDDEIALLNTLSRIVWVGLFLFLLSGLLFMWLQYVDKGEVLYLASEPFVAKLVIYAVLFANAFIFHYHVFPKMLSARTKEGYGKAIENHSVLVSIVGSISIVSWITLLMLGSFRSITPKYLSFEDTLALYGAFLLFAVVISGLILRRRGKF